MVIFYALIIFNNSYRKVALLLLEGVREKGVREDGARDRGLVVAEMAAVAEREAVAGGEASMTASCDLGWCGICRRGWMRQC